MTHQWVQGLIANEAAHQWEIKDSMRFPIETERLILRPFEVADTEAAFGWFGDTSQRLNFHFGELKRQKHFLRPEALQ